ncbi:MAG TPA: CARDB domain-containing protein [Solirubrobacteraceae bacterium]|nr:CARDB domain-containing protein [Solirubrobacteraceae bacterium]
MSFFDEADEPPRTESRSPSRSSARRRPSGSGGSGSGRGSRRRPPSRPPQQSIRTRRGIALLALVIAIVVIAVAVNSCEGSANKSALQNYGDSVYSIVGQSKGTSKALFAALAKAGSTDASTTGQAVAQASSDANTELKRAERLSVPGAAHGAQSHLVHALQERVDGLTNLAAEIQPALGSEHQEGVQQITGDMALFLASDVEYKQYAVKQLVSALHGANIVVGGENGTPINASQFLPSLSWLEPSYVGAQLGVSVSSGSGSTSSGPVTGLHGDGLNSVSYNGTTLTDGTAVTASPPPTFTLSVTDQGNYTETDVICKVEVVGTSVSGTKVIPSIAKGQTTTCDVTLRSSPPQGNYTIKAMVEKVPGEKDLTNNSQGVAVTFK